MKKTWMKVSALVLAAVVLLGAAGCGFSYLEDDIAPYVTFDKAKFDALTISLDVQYEVTEADIEEAIFLNLLTKREAENGGEKQTYGVIGKGDDVDLWFTGFVTKADGAVEVVRDDASEKTFNNTPHTYTLGGDAFRVEGLEEAFYGKDISSYLTEIKGTVKPNAIYFLSYNYNDYMVNEDGTRGNYVANGRVEGINRIPADELDSKITAGFAEAFAESVVGEQFDFEKRALFEVTVDGDYGNGATRRVYTVFLCGQTENEFVYTGKFANDGGVYAGLTAEMHVQFVRFADYTVPELTADTAVNLFAIDKESEDPVAEFRKQITDSLLSDEERIAEMQDAIWEELKKCVTVTSLPESKVKTMYKVFLKTVEDYYKEAENEEFRRDFVDLYGEAALANIDTFAVAMLRGNAGERAEDVVRRKAEEWVREDLVVFAVMKYSGMEMPTGETLETGVDAELANLMKSTSKTEKELYKMYGGREYFIASYCRNVMLDKLCDTVTVVYTKPEIK